MQAPELLLSQLNHSLRELRGAAQVLGDEGALEAELLPVMRRLLLAEVMGSLWTLAVGGSQGAGKTTLMRTMYGLQGQDAAWLEPNEGRGETLPVLIQESNDHEQPQGYMRALRLVDPASGRFDVVEEALDVDTFRQACGGAVPEALLPVLKVPRRYFAHSGQAMLLLPGYEGQRRDNKVWQELMRQALVDARSCLIVTDATRLANRGQQDIAKDLSSNELRIAHPIIVVSKTEGLAGQPERLDELRRTAAEVFGLEGNEAWQQVICAGVDDAEAQSGYVQQWQPQLAAALRDVAVGGSETRQFQLSRLEETLSRDLNRVVNLIRSRATVFLQQSGDAGDAQDTLRNCMEAFDEACANLREEHRSVVESFLARQTGQAWDKLQNRLVSDHEGLLNKLGNTFKTVTETQRRLERDVVHSWESSGNVLSEYTTGLGQLTHKALGMGSAAPALPASAPVLQRLGYVDGKGQALPSRMTDDSVRSNLTALLCSSAGDADAARPGKDLERTAALLPAMALEYTRIACAVPQLVNVDPTALATVPEFDALAALRNVEQQFTEFKNVGTSLLKGLGAVLAVDFAVDGEVNAIPALLSALGLGSAGNATAAGTAAGSGAAVAAGTTAASVATAVAGVVALGYVAHSAMQEVRRHDGHVRSLASSMLQNMRERHLAHFLSRFDETMERMRSHLRQSLRRRYGLDQRLMEQDRLAKALADVRVLQRDLLDELARSGRTLQLFAPSAAA